MLGPLGNYLYDRRRGLIKSAGIVGTIYFAGKYAIQRLEEVKEAVLTERNSKENLRRRFQQNMQDCTYTIMAYMPTLASRIFEELDVERISLELQQRSKNATSIKSGEATSNVQSSASLSSSMAGPELEANSPTSRLSSISGREQGVHERPLSTVPSSGQHSSFLSNLESTELLASSLPLSSGVSSSMSQVNPMTESATSWVNFNHISSQASAAENEEVVSAQNTSSDAILTVPDLELPSTNPSEISIVDPQPEVEARPSNVTSSFESSASHGDMGDRQGSIKHMSKAELWHELKITTFTRVLVIIYTTTLLSLQIHLQLNLIGKYKYIQSVKELERHEREREKERQRNENAFDNFGLVGSFFSAIAPTALSKFGFSSISQDEEGDDLWREVDEDIERKYLTLSWWLLHIGWRDIASRSRMEAENVLQGVSLKSRLSAKDLRGLIIQIRKQIEFLSDGRTCSDITSAIFPPSPSAEQNVLIQGGISPHLATVDAPLRRLLDETRAYVKSVDFDLVWGKALDKVTDIVLDGIEKEAFGGPMASVGPMEEQRERLAALLPGMARWCHPALFSLPNELVEGLASMRELAGFSAIIYTSYSDSDIL